MIRVCHSGERLRRVQAIRPTRDRNLENASHDGHWYSTRSVRSGASLLTQTKKKKLNILLNVGHSIMHVLLELELAPPVVVHEYVLRTCNPVLRFLFLFLAAAAAARGVGRPNTSFFVLKFS